MSQAVIDTQSIDPSVVALARQGINWGSVDQLSTVGAIAAPTVARLLHIPSILRSDFEEK